MASEASLHTPSDDPGAELALQVLETSPAGPPVALAPLAMGSPGVIGDAEQVNVFWSERVREDIALRTMRPAALPPMEDSGVVGSSVSPARELLPLMDGALHSSNAVTDVPMASGVSAEGTRNDEVVRRLMDDNQKLRAEIEGLKSMFAGGNGGSQGFNQGSGAMFGQVRGVSQPGSGVDRNASMPNLGTSLTGWTD